MDVSIIFVNYNTSALIIDSLRSVELHTSLVSYEVIVVDNASEPYLELILKESFPRMDLKVICLDENIGFGRANNVGLKYASGRNIFFLNPDTILLNNAIGILSSVLDNNLSVGACGGNLYDVSMQPAYSFRRMLPGYEWELNELFNHRFESIRYGKNLRFNYSDNLLPVGVISGADLMIKKSVVDSIGGFSDEFFMYYEETDLCARVKAAGYELMNVPDAKIQHLEGGSFESSQFNPTRVKRSEQGRAIYYKRNYGKFKTAICNSIYWFFLVSRAVLLRSKEYAYRVKLNTYNDLIDQDGRM